MASLAAVSDTFVCGSCNSTYHDLVAFLEHKRSTSCAVTVNYDSIETQENITVLAQGPPLGNKIACHLYF